MARQRRDLWELVAHGGLWWTLRELSEVTGHPEASISARLRDFRKTKYGGHTVLRRRKYGIGMGTWEYRLVPREEAP